MSGVLSAKTSVDCVPYCVSEQGVPELSKNFFLFIIVYKGADKSLVRPTSRCILFDG